MNATATIDAGTSTAYRSASVGKKKMGRPPNPAGPNKPIGTRPKPHVLEALRKYKEDQDVFVTDAAVLAAALEEFLKTRGYLPKS